VSSESTTGVTEMSSLSSTEGMTSVKDDQPIPVEAGVTVEASTDSRAIRMFKRHRQLQRIKEELALEAGKLPSWMLPPETFTMASEAALVEPNTTRITYLNDWNGNQTATTVGLTPVLEGYANHPSASATILSLTSVLGLGMVLLSSIVGEQKNYKIK